MLSIVATGLTLFCPSYFGADPWTGSNIPKSSPIFAPAATPKPPTSWAASSERMSPNKFVVTMTSKDSGRLISCMVAASMCRSSSSTCGYDLATSCTAPLKIPSVILRIFPLCTNVNRFLRFMAKSKANLATLSEAVFVMILIATPTPGVTSNSFPEYNPSVFSRTMTMSIPGFNEGTFGRVRAGRMFA